ncbi:MAG: hypothetical protein HOQ44_13720 [Nocardia sp.]|nr:hypothetical protein [Nocardia sp.]
MAADDQLDRPLAADELAAIADDPLRAYVEPDRSLRGTSNSLAEGGIIIYPNFGSVDGARAFHEDLCDTYNNARARPDFDPIRSAAEFQRDLISGHSWEGPFHGRQSRVAMNFLLEQSGKPPSAVADFDRDLFTSRAQWVDDVEAGSDRYQRWAQKLDRSGPDIDPVELTDLTAMKDRYEQSGGEPSPFTPGEWHDKAKFERMHTELRSAT